MRQTHAVIVSPQIPRAYKNGGIATFVGHLSNLLLTRGRHRVTLIFTEAPGCPDDEWQSFYSHENLDVVCVHRKPLELPKSYFPTIRISELAVEAIPDDADVVYFAEWRANALHAIRKRRFNPRHHPPIVTVMHGNSEWNRQGLGLPMESYEQMFDEHLERYVVRNTDYLVSPSEHMLRWCREQGWETPSADHVLLLRNPFLSTRKLNDLGGADRRFKRIIFYGRLETRKGFDLFVEVMSGMKGDAALDGISEIVLVGSEGVHRSGSSRQAAASIEASLKVRVKHLKDLDTMEANRYLEDHRSDSLVVLPSLLDNLPYSLIESSMIPGLNVICSTAGGFSELLGDAYRHQLFEPNHDSLSQALRDWLGSCPKPESQLFRYNPQDANERWIQLHDQLAEDFRSSGEQPSVSRPSLAKPRGKALVDICIPYYNAARYLPQLLESLNNQTVDTFNVFAVDDGSTEENSRELYRRLAEKYRSRGWIFASTQNHGPCSARNYAVSLGDSPYLCFMDSDNIAVPNMVERFIQSIEQSGYDCLTCYLYRFRGSAPLAGLLRHAQHLSPDADVHLPFGNFPEAGLLLNVFGDVTMIIRRQVFEEIEGFSTDYDPLAGNEDHELLARLSLMGYQLDVVPEFLCYYRVVPGSRSARMDIHSSRLRVLRHYEKLLSEVGLRRLAPIASGLKGPALNQQQTKPWTPLEEDEVIGRLVEEVHWSLLLRALPRKVKRLSRLWWEQRLTQTPR
ncbi:MAG: glycosyltransferase [Verrucomicrobia bacterium]|nr:glycosyltransferase [Verrucomicrobiota bacterium]